jgi:hypothetical protein
MNLVYSASLHASYSFHKSFRIAIRELENTKSFHIFWFAISQDSRVLAGGGRGAIQLWDMTSGKIIGTGSVG